jgi:hypothetical protein
MLVTVDARSARQDYMAWHDEAKPKEHEIGVA